MVDQLIAFGDGCPAMTASAELELKQRLAQLSERERRDMSAYLLRLKHDSKTGRRELTRLMKEMDSGKKTPLSKLSASLRHG